MARIFVDGRPHDVRADVSLLDAILSAGIDLPYFCWHPAMGSVGACRLCAVKKFKDENDVRGKIVMACMERVEEGLRVSVEDGEARACRAAVIEWLMTNHPHDCPVCDEGGECHLQDMTVMTGHVHRRFRFKKRTFRNQDLGPFVTHEMNRCIVCYRCVRFYREYAGGTDLAAFAGHNRVYFGRHREGPLESEFSGNLVEVCPTGVFTDKTLKRHYARKWDLTSAPSVCIHCGLGCNTIVGGRYGRLRRVLNRYHPDVNGYFLCDRGRFGYEFVNSEKRILSTRCVPKRSVGTSDHKGGPIGEAAWALAQANRVVGIGSPRASVEANYVLKKLVGPENFFLGISDSEAGLASLALEILAAAPEGPASLKTVGESRAALVLGEDVTNAAPMLALALRQTARQKPLDDAGRLGIPRWLDGAARTAAQDATGPLFVVSPYATKLDGVATRAHRAAPADIGRLGFAVARAIDSAAPAPEGLREEDRLLAAEIAGALRDVERPAIVAGVTCGEDSVLRAAANIVAALRAAGRFPGLCLTFPECNTLGLALVGGRRLEELLRELPANPVDAAIILENDLFRRAGPAEVDKCLRSIRELIALDHLENATSARADILLPSATFAESAGTLVNNEGRAQRFFRVMPPQGEARESWRWLRDIGVALARPGFERLEVLDDLIREMAAQVPALEGVRDAAPLSSFRMDGQKVPRAPHRESGRTAMNAARDVSEPQPPGDPDSALSMTMEGRPGIPNPALVPFYWSPGWNSGQALNMYQSEVAGPLRGGAPGRRLIVSKEGPPPYYPAPPPSGHENGKWTVVPVHHIYGSEELSSLSPGIAELSPKPYLLMNREEAIELGIEEGSLVELEAEGVKLELNARLAVELARGTAGIPVGLPGLFWPPAKRGIIRRVPK
ncbi:MAG: NADH-quinone oxidoreductase subunit G [Candidatus Aminicenantes bacterium RBG_16_63_16]|nr:MAG: NADH-quinone oxidoreductase subunit G [Candidatus Aminicenantes bacterium RBG_16_63_16]